MRILCSYLSIILLVLPLNVLAKEQKKLFVITAATASNSATVDFNNVEDATLIFGRTSLKNFLPGYDDGTGLSGLATASQVQFQLDFRGLGMQLGYSAGQSALSLVIPELGINRSFDGGNRRASAELFYDWLKENQDGSTNLIIGKLVAVSPVDVLAGNPASLMAQIIDDVSDGAMFIDNRPEHNDLGISAESRQENQFGIGVEVSRYQTDRGDINKVKMPLSYTTRFDHKPGMQLDLKLPVSYQEVAGAKSYSLPFSALLRYPVTDVWTLTPAASYGIAGSEDLGSGGKIYSAMLTSSYILVFDNFNLTVGNLVGKLKTQDIDFGDYQFEPKLSNSVLRNGILWSKPVNWLGDQNFIEVFFVNTRMSGTDLLVDNYNVIGGSFGPGRSKIGENNTYNYGFKYLFSDEVKGFSFDVTYWF